MTELQRLLNDAGTSDLQRSLLGSLANETPTPQARERTLAALGLPAVVGGVVSAGAAAKAAASSGAGSGAGTLSLPTLLKWSGALMALSIAGGGAYVAAAHGTPVPQVPTTGPGIQQSHLRELAGGGPAKANASAASTTSMIPTLPTTSRLSRPDSTKATRSTAAQRTAYPPSSGGTLMEELSLVERARQSFAQGSYGDAARAASAYDAAFPHGSFMQEAAFIRVQSLYARRVPTGPNGDTGANGDGPDAAVSAARAFLTQHPSSPYASRVRTLLSGGP